MGTLSDSRYTKTSETLTVDHGESGSMSSVVDSHAKTSAQRVAVEDLPETVRDFGSRCSESLARYDLALSSRKTVRTCVPVDSAPSSKDLPAWGMTADGVCWELGTRARLTAETDSGLLPTPTCQGNELSPSMQKWAAHRRLAALLSTPTAQTYGSNRGGAAGRTGKDRPSLERRFNGLNVLTLREWMMGFPIGWTALEPLETDKFQRWLRSHGGF